MERGIEICGGRCFESHVCLCEVGRGNAFKVIKMLGAEEDREETRRGREGRGGQDDTLS